MDTIGRLNLYLSAFTKALKLASRSIGIKRDTAATERTALMQMRVILAESLTEVNCILERLDADISLGNSQGTSPTLNPSKSDAVSNNEVPITTLRILENALNELTVYVPDDLLGKLKTAVNNYGIELNRQLDAYQSKLLDFRMKEYKSARIISNGNE